jgi:hypothetical protein
MKHDRQIGIRVGFPVFFALELEEYHEHASGAHRALAFPDFVGFLTGLGLEEYRRRYAGREAPDFSDPPDDGETEPEQAARFGALAPAWEEF